MKRLGPLLGIILILILPSVSSGETSGKLAAAEAAISSGGKPRLSHRASPPDEEEEHSDLPALTPPAKSKRRKVVREKPLFESFGDAIRVADERREETAEAILAGERPATKAGYFAPSSAYRALPMNGLRPLGRGRPSGSAPRQRAAP